LLLYFYLASRVPSRASSASLPDPAGDAKPRGSVIAAAVLTAVALGAGPAWSRVEPAGDATARVTPVAVAGWSGPEVHLSDWRPLYAQPDEEVLVTYHSESAGDVALYRAVYYSQRQGKELLGHGNTVVGERHRTQASKERAVIVSGETVRVSEQLVQSMDGSELLIWSLYTVDGRPNSMHLSDQLVYGLRSLVRAPSAGVIAFAAPCRPSCDTARDALGALASQVLPATLTPLATAHDVTAVAPRG
jgi:EpsI family protein